MKSRRILLTIDSVVEMLKDYCGQEDIPPDALPLKLMLNPKERKKLGVLVSSDTWDGELAPLLINFNIKRIYGGA